MRLMVWPKWNKKSNNVQMIVFTLRRPILLGRLSYVNIRLNYSNGRLSYNDGRVSGMVNSYFVFSFT